MDASVSSPEWDGDGLDLLFRLRKPTLDGRAELILTPLQLLDPLRESLQRQVAVEVRIMKVYLDDDTQTGVSWDRITHGDYSGSLTTFNAGEHVDDAFSRFSIEGADVSGVIEAVSRSGDLRTVSSPRITTRPVRDVPRSRHDRDADSILDARGSRFNLNI